MRPLLRKTKVRTWRADNLKLISCFMDTHHEPLHLRKIRSGRVTDHGHISFILNICLTKLLNMAIVRKFEVMLGKMLNHLTW
jgi:hypothetical protein